MKDLAVALIALGLMACDFFSVAVPQHEGNPEGWQDWASFWLCASYVYFAFRAWAEYDLRRKGKW